ncbi:MAG: hypothetical protein RBT41_08375 [Clostridia bacterium]|jgi:hypothetical protein|nr:hypothetical protein [Clostridia bacterium]
MRKIYHRLSLIQIILLFGAYGLQEFAARNTGLMQYLVYLSRKWEAVYPVATLQYAVIALLCALAGNQVVQALKLVKQKEAAVASLKKKQAENVVALTKKKVRYLVLQMVLLTLCYVIFTLSYTSQSFAAYYFLSLALLIAALLQYIRITLYLRNPDILTVSDTPMQPKKKK